MTSPCFLVKSSAAKFAFYPIIVCLRFFLDWIEIRYSSTTSWTTSSLPSVHSLSECKRLLFPFGHFSFWFWWSCFGSHHFVLSKRFVILLFSFHFFNVISFSLFFHIKCFTFLLKHFLTNLFMFFKSHWIEFSTTHRTWNSFSVILHHWLWGTTRNCIWSCLHCSFFIYAHTSLISTKVWVCARIILLCRLMTSFYWRMLHLWSLVMSKCCSFIILRKIWSSHLSALKTVWLLRFMTIAVQSFVFSIVAYLSSCSIWRSPCWLILWIFILVFVVCSTVNLFITLGKIISANIRFKSFSVIWISRCRTICWKNWCVHCIYVWVIKRIIRRRIHWRFSTISSSIHTSSWSLRLLSIYHWGTLIHR